MEKIVLFYDGECGFCNQTVQWIVKRNKTHTIFYAPLQGSYAKNILEQQFKVDKTIDSLIVYRNNQILFYTDAVLSLTKELDGAWKLFYVFKILPKAIRDWGYKGFAKRRYKWFGKADFCQIPTPQQRKQFLD